MNINFYLRSAVSTHHISYHLPLLYIECIKYQLLYKHKTNTTRIVQ